MRKPFNGDFKLTQKFNDACCRASYSQFGLMGHNGVDYGLPTGTEIVAPHDGKITEFTTDPTGYGIYLKIENDRYASILAHLKESKVKLNDIVKEGQLVGLSNNTGNSTGAHLHWGLYVIPRDKTNGFNGYVDPLLVLNLAKDSDCEEKLIAVEKTLTEVRESRDKWKRQVTEDADKYAKELAIKQQYIEDTETKLALANKTVTALGKNLVTTQQKLDESNAKLKQKLSQFSWLEFLQAKLGRS